MVFVMCVAGECTEEFCKYFFPNFSGYTLGAGLDSFLNVRSSCLKKEPKVK